MNSSAIEQSRRLCADTPEGIPHLVDAPRAHRCDQHRAQRHRWSDANLYRKRNGLPLLEWIPDPLTAERRREALRDFSDRNAADIVRAAEMIKRTISTLAQIRGDLPSASQQHFDVGAARIVALASDLLDTAAAMGTPSQR